MTLTIPTDLSIDEIDTAINDLTKLKQSKLHEWKIPGGEYSLTASGEIYTSNSTTKVRQFGMEFNAQEQAISALDAYKKYHILYKIAESVNPTGWKANFDVLNSTDKYYIYQNYNNEFFINKTSSINIHCGVFFASLEIAMKALAILKKQID